LLAGSAGAQLLQPPAVRPDALMSALTAEVTAILKADLAAGRRTDVAQLVATKILPVFDFEHMTRMAAARNWRLATPEQQALLVAQFRMLLVRTYSGALAEYRGQDIEYRPLRTGAGETEVLVRSFLRQAGAEPLTIDYDMENGPAGWKVFDVKIAGISLVMNYRETFAAEVRRGGIDRLIESLSERNRRNDQGAIGADAETLAPVLIIFSAGSRAKQ
jgi:phospholipid transport system substrate-binding protein